MGIHPRFVKIALAVFLWDVTCRLVFWEVITLSQNHVFMGGLVIAQLDIMMRRLTRTISPLKCQSPANTSGPPSASALNRGAALVVSAAPGGVGAAASTSCCAWANTPSQVGGDTNTFILPDSLRDIPVLPLASMAG